MEKQNKGSVRMNISLSQDLKRRMDQVEESVNWSALAARAFQGKLAELAAKKDQKTMDDVIQRLRESRLKLEEADYHAGKEVGCEWAKNDAEARELITLDKTSIQCNDWPNFFTTDGSDAFSAAERFVEAIRGEGDSLRDEADEFWTFVVGDDWQRVVTDDWARGFADGALELWDEVKGSL
jgi:hypothetical protein